MKRTKPPFRADHVGSLLRPPELKEAIEAARDISDDPAAQAEIAAALMGLPVEDVKKEVMRSIAQRKMTERVATISRGGARPAVVVHEVRHEVHAVVLADLQLEPVDHRRRVRLSPYHIYQITHYQKILLNHNDHAALHLHFVVRMTVHSYHSNKTGKK